MIPPFAAVEFALAPFLWLGLAAVPVLIFFLLRRRLRDETIATTLFWRRALEESPARAAWRRPNEWLSLILLLLAVAAATLAAADLRLGFSSGVAKKNIFVVDVSASMSAKSGDETRLDQALRAIRAAVDGMRAGTEIELIAAGARPRVVSHLTGDETALRAAIDRIGAEPAEGDPDAAVALAIREAESAASRGAAVEVTFFTDGAVADGPAPKRPESAIPVKEVRVGKDVENAGIVRIAGAGEGREAAVVVTVGGGAAAALNRRVVLMRGGDVHDAADVTIEPHGHAGAIFRLSEKDIATPADWTVELDPKDAMPMDDVAYFSTAPRPPARALIVGEPDPFLDRLADVFPEAEFSRIAPDAIAAADGPRPWDLVIVTAPVKGPIPAASRELWIGVTPEGFGLAPEGDLVHPVFVGADFESPILRGVEFEELQVIAARIFRAPPPARPIVRLAGGTAFWALEADGREAYFWSSGILESNWMLIPAFPLVVKNLLGHRMQSTAIDARRADTRWHLPAGLDELSGVVSLTARSATGGEEKATLRAREEFFPASASVLGHHRFTAVDSNGIRAEHALGVSLFADAETTARIQPIVAVASANGGAPVVLEQWRPTTAFWRVFVIGAIILLLFEAAIFHRR